MKVLGNRVLVKRLEDKKLTSSLIEVITTQTSEPGFYAVVAGVGQGQRLADGRFIPIECKVGELVILKKYSGAPVVLKSDNGMQEDFHLVNAEDVLAVVDR